MKPLINKMASRRIGWCIALLTAAISGRADFLELPEEGIEVVGVETIAIAAADDTLADIARRYNVGHLEIRIANPDVEFWLPGEGTKVQIPSRYILPRAARKGFVLNVPEMRLYYYPTPVRGEEIDVLITHPVSIGRQDWATPLGSTRITSKVAKPSWTPPKSIREEAIAEGDPLPAIVPPGPDNPLGDHALRLAIPGYLLHGTNRPYGVGMRVTHGCIRMYPEDIEALYARVPVGTPVEFVNQPVKMGWHQEGLFIEVHPLLEEDERGPGDLERIAYAMLQEYTTTHAVRVSDAEFSRALIEKTGMPVLIGRRVN